MPFPSCELLWPQGEKEKASLKLHIHKLAPTIRLTVLTSRFFPLECIIILNFESIWSLSNSLGFRYYRFLGSFVYFEKKIPSCCQYFLIIISPWKSVWPKALNPKMLHANIFVKLVQWILVKKSKNWLYSHKTNTCNSGFVLPVIIVIYFINEFESPI